MIFFYITYITAIVLGIFCSDYQLTSGSVGSNPITLGTVCFLYIVIGGYWWLSRHKDHPVIGPIFHIIKMFFVVLFATLFVNYAKKEVKKWWNKD